MRYFTQATNEGCVVIICESVAVYSQVMTATIAASRPDSARTASRLPMSFTEITAIGFSPALYLGPLYVAAFDGVPVRHEESSSRALCTLSSASC